MTAKHLKPNSGYVFVINYKTERSADIGRQCEELRACVQSVNNSLNPQKSDYAEGTPTTPLLTFTNLLCYGNKVNICIHVYQFIVRVDQVSSICGLDPTSAHLTVTHPAVKVEGMTAVT